MNRRFLILLLAFATSFASRSGCGDEGASPFRGYWEINRALTQRITGRTGFHLGQYVDEAVDIPAADGLLQLLGAFQDSGTQTGFRNGAPNAINVLLWTLLLSRFAEDIGRLCDPSGDPVGDPSAPHHLKVLPSFRSALDPVCAWPKPVSYSPVTLLPYWEALVGYCAPDDQFDAWQAFAAEEAKGSRPVAEAVARLTLAAFLNPYFLLRD